MTCASQILSNRVRALGIGVLPKKSVVAVGGGRCSSGCRFGLAAQLVARALGDARRLPGAPAQVVELGAPHGTAAHHFDRGDAWRIKREDALDALAIADLAQREVRVDPGVLAGDADALERLDAFALAL